MQQKNFSAAELSKLLGMEVSTTHRRIQLAMELCFIQADSNGGKRVKYTERDLLVIKVLDAAYRIVSNNEKLMELLAPKNVKDVQQDGIGYLISTVVRTINEMLEQYTTVSYQLEKTNEMVGLLSRKMANIQDKLDALWVKLDRYENRFDPDL